MIERRPHVSVRRFRHACTLLCLGGHRLSLLSIQLLHSRDNDSPDPVPVHADLGPPSTLPPAEWLLKLYDCPSAWRMSMDPIPHG